MTDVPSEEPSRRSRRRARAPRVRRRRGAAESLGSVVLVFESIIVFLGGLVVYGLRAVPDGFSPWWGVAGGAGLAVVMVAVSGLLRHRWGIVLGWVLQGVVVASAIVVPAMLVVAFVFGGMWAYATIKGASLDRRNARLAGEAETSNGD